MGVQIGEFPGTPLTCTYAVTERNVKEQIFLGVTYRAVQWVREGYTTLAQRHKIDPKELSESPFALSWETIACILAARDSIYNENYYCCGNYNGLDYPTRHCRCRTLVAVNQGFQEELWVLEEFPPGKRVKFFVVRARSCRD